MIKNGDSFSLIKELDDNSVDLVVMDPPYVVECKNGGGTVNKISRLKDSLAEIDEAGISKGYDIKVLNTELVRVMKDINIYIWCNKVMIPDYFNFYVNNLHCKFEIICWHKTNALPTYSNKYLTDTEYLLFFKNGASCHPADYEDAKTYYISPLNQNDKKLWGHPTIKPLELTEKIIRNSSNEGDTVLDCFMGSGTTGVAAKRLNRNFIGFEINKKYFDIAQKRINFESSFIQNTLF